MRFESGTKTVVLRNEFLISETECLFLPFGRVQLEIRLAREEIVFDRERNLSSQFTNLPNVRIAGNRRCPFSSNCRKAVIYVRPNKERLEWRNVLERAEFLRAACETKT